MSELIDNRAHRIRTLKDIIRRLHSGEAPDRVKDQLKELVRETDGSEIAAMEQELMAEGIPVEEIMGMCDLHSQVLRDLVVERRDVPIVEGHPIDTFKRENAALRETAEALRSAFKGITSVSGDSIPDAGLLQVRNVFNDLMDVEKHYRRKENLLFPFLEKHGITGPSKVMWGKDDEVRDFLKSIGEALEQEGVTATEWEIVVPGVIEPALAALEEMIYKEEKILFPMALETLNEVEWGQIWSQTPEYGYCLVDPGDQYRPPRMVDPQSTIEVPKEGSIIFPTGALSFDQLRGLFGALPVDVTFVDADDRVRYFSEGADRVFARSKAIIGRKVQHCHPPKSVDTVERILVDFRAGRQNKAEFWIQLHGKFVHISYYAVRNEQGDYLGTLEVTQDLTHFRALEGERRLLQYD